MNYYRAKLLNAVLYFCQNTKRCNTTKLLKLLAFLDFAHFKQTGYPSIGLIYHAWKRGPVPISFYEEIKGGNIPNDFSNMLASIPQEFADDYPEIKGYLYKAKAKIDESVFTPREMKILKWLCDVFRDATANQMSEVTHLHREPWDTTKKTKGLYQYIDYLLAIDDTSSLCIDEARDKLREHFEIVNNFGLNPTEVK